jgi:predicted ATPase
VLFRSSFAPEVSDRVLRVAATCAAIINPWGGSVRVFEQPEAGIHAARYDVLAQRLVSLVVEEKCQVVLATASPVFCESLLRANKDSPDILLLQNVHKTKTGTQVQPASTKQLFLDRKYWSE